MGPCFGRMMCSGMPSASAEVSSRRALLMAEQVQHSKNAGARWHPEVIKWAIALYVRGHGQYERFRSGGHVTLPAGRQLQRDVNSVKMHHGIVAGPLDELRASAMAQLLIPEQ